MSAFEVGKPAPYYCDACQAVPQAGYCLLTGCPTAPKSAGSKPAPSEATTGWGYEGESVFAVEYIQLCCGRGYASCCGEPEVHAERRQVAHCAPEYAPLLAAAPNMLAELKRCLMGCGDRERIATLIAEAEGK